MSDERKAFDDMILKEQLIIKKAVAMFDVLSVLGYYIPIECLIDNCKSQETQ